MTQLRDEDLISAARGLPGVQPSPERVAAVRHQLLEAVQQTPQRPPRRSVPRLPWPAAAAIIFAVIGGTAWWMAPPPVSPRWASVVTSGTATFEYLRSSDGSREWVRLQDGRILLDVLPLMSPKHFMIEAAGAQIETQGSLLEVDVIQARLTRVQVLSGRAEVRRDGHAVVSLVSGQTWSENSPRGSETAASTPKALDEPALGRKSSRAAPKPSVPRSRKAPRRAASKPPTNPPEARAARSKGEEPPAERAFRKGWGSLRAGDFDEAAEAFGRAIVKGSEVREDASYWRAIALLRAGKATEAERAFEAYLGEYSSGRRGDEAALLLGRLRWARGDTKGAQPWLQRASDGSDPAVQEKARRLMETGPIAH